MHGVAGRATKDAIAEAAPMEAARAAAGATAGRRERAARAGAGSGDVFAAELRRAGLLPMLVLHLCGQEPSYGGRLMERVTALTAGLVAVNPNTMYPLLRRLESDGLIEGHWEHPERRSRRFYALTDAGEAERERLLGEFGPRLDAVAAAVDGLRAELR